MTNKLWYHIFHGCFHNWNNDTMQKKRTAINTKKTVGTNSVNSYLQVISNLLQK